MAKKKTEELLKQQVLAIMEEDGRSDTDKEKKSKRKNRKKRHRVLKALGITVLAVLALFIFFIGTKPGRSLIYKAASRYVFKNLQYDNTGDDKKEPEEKRKPSEDVVHEEHIFNYLLFGIEEFYGAKNTDAMLIATIDTKEAKIKLTSLLRDSYVEIPGYKANKLNSAYAKGGADLLIETIEKNYMIHIDGYASVDFEAFEKIVDLLGGIEIELGKEEAEYLNRTNYISKKANRNVVPGVNKLNGNQVLGYVRVRKVKTLGGANYDYGRVIRQQRALSAMLKSLMSSKNILKIFSIASEALGYVTTDLDRKEIEKMMSVVVENRITTMETFRIPVDGAFDAPKKYNGIGYPIILDWETNRIELFKFIYGYTEEEAKESLAKIAGSTQSGN
ncbi:MAG: LytR family transcriptional regulator [Clostridiales bacterium]|nr:LytR family transcriptional regulator [Clostridiales bacterium]